MSTTVQLTLNRLVEDTLDQLYEVTERPRVVTIGSTALATTSDTSFTVQSGDETLLNVTDLVEWERELVLITAKSADATPVFTCARAYAGTIPSAHPTGTSGRKNPAWTRDQAARSVNKYFGRAGNIWLPVIVSQSMSPGLNQLFIEMPVTTLRVFEVRYMNPTSGRIIHIDNWWFEENLPTGDVTSTKAIRIPRTVSSTDQIIVTYQTAYVWSGGNTNPEDDTVDVPVGSEELPSLYGSAYLLAGREIARTDIGHTEEWNQDQVNRAGVNIRLLNAQWGRFYRSLDEARRIHDVPKRRPYRRLEHV